MNGSGSGTADRLRAEALRRAQQKSSQEASHHAGYYYDDEQDDDGDPQDGNYYRQPQQSSSSAAAALHGEPDFPEQYFGFPAASATRQQQPPMGGNFPSASPRGSCSPPAANYHDSLLSPSSSNNNSSSATNANHHHPHPYATPRGTTTRDSSPTAAAAATDLAAAARHEWRQHGSNRSQALEELRLRHWREIVVRVEGAATRVDAARCHYTAYRIRVAASGSNSSNNNDNGAATPPGTLLERRYSEFAKLHARLRQRHPQLYPQQVLSRAPFPERHWAGRLGPWTPSRVWAPAHHEALIELRVQQLDAWLVWTVAHFFHRTGAPELADFLSDGRDSAFSKPPYQQRNDCGDGAVEPVRWNNPLTFTLGSAIRQAVRTVQLMTTSTSSSSSSSSSNNKNNSIPLDLLQAAAGLVFLTVAKAGCVVSGRLGTGVMVARLKNQGNNNNNNNWSAPVALGTLGMGWGAQIGGDVTHYLVVLTTDQAVTDFAHGGAVHLGAELDIAVGPAGRSATVAKGASDWTLHSAYAYAHSQGLFAGISLEGSVVTVRRDVNAKFYGRPGVDVAELLRNPGRGAVTAAEPLYEALDRALQMEIPPHAFRPSQLWQQPQLCVSGGGGADKNETSTVYGEEQQQQQQQQQQHPSVTATAAQAMANSSSSNHGQYYR